MDSQLSHLLPRARCVKTFPNDFPRGADWCGMGKWGVWADRWWWWDAGERFFQMGLMDGDGILLEFEPSGTQRQFFYTLFELWLGVFLLSLTLLFTVARPRKHCR